ncbi:MAG: non-canonical purine NTP pyrophosphatase [Clostridiaceae bacterium]|nr:non-canonical purine NTP pyrophosphatase [Clostridiaceae bacterium]
MKVLFATTNESKAKRYVEELKKEGIELITIKDLGFELDIDENGKNAIENAQIKARAYYDATKITTIGMDDNLFIEELPEEKQPGTHVRRVNGKELSDDEMIIYYTNLVKEYGGKLTAKWVYGMVIYDGKEEKQYSWSKSNFVFTDKASKNRTPGYPLSSISIIPEYNKYLTELNEEENKEYKKNNNTENVVNFILNSVK